MPSVKVLKKKSKALDKANLNQKEVENLFEKLIGTNKVDLVYALPRFKQMHQKLRGFLKAGCTMTEEFFLGDTESYNVFVEYQEHGIKTCSLIDLLPEFDKHKLVFGQFTEDDEIKFTKVYNEFRQSDTIKKLLITASQLKAFSRDLEARKSTFVYSGAGMYLKPLVFCSSFDIFSLRAKDPNDRLVIGWINYLRKILELGEYLSNELQQPDIDIKKFCETVITILTSAEKEPGLQGCKGAFTKIKESMHMLEENFPKYYKEFVNSDKNSTTIFVSFIKDVTEKNTNSHISVVAQFTKILNFYIEQMEKNGVKLDPKISQLAEQTRDSLKKFSDTATKESKSD